MHTMSSSAKHLIIISIENRGTKQAHKNNAPYLGDGVCFVNFFFDGEIQHSVSVMAHAWSRPSQMTWAEKNSYKSILFSWLDRVCFYAWSAPMTISVVVTILSHDCLLIEISAQIPMITAWKCWRMNGHNFFLRGVNRKLATENQSEWTKLLMASDVNGFDVQGVWIEFRWMPFMHTPMTK